MAPRRSRAQRPSSQDLSRRRISYPTSPTRTASKAPHNMAAFLEPATDGSAGAFVERAISHQVRAGLFCLSSASQEDRDSPPTAPLRSSALAAVIAYSVGSAEGDPPSCRVETSRLRLQERARAAYYTARVRPAPRTFREAVGPLVRPKQDSSTSWLRDCGRGRSAGSARRCGDLSSRDGWLNWTFGAYSE